MALIYDEDQKQETPEQTNGTGANQTLSKDQLGDAETSKSGSNSGAGGNYSAGDEDRAESDVDKGEKGTGTNSEPKDNETLGKGYTGSNSKNKPSKTKTILKAATGNKKALISGGAGAGILGLALFFFFSAATLKIDHIINNLQSRFFATSENAVQNETSNLFIGYMTKVLPSYKSCGTVIDRTCSVNIIGTNPVDRLYRAWSNAKIENTLADKYNISFSYDTASKTYYLRAPGANETPEGDPVGTDAQVSRGDFGELTNEISTRTEIRQTVNTALKNETLWKQVMYRYKVGRLLEEKYGIKRCIIACGSVRDPLADFPKQKVVAMQIFLTQRVLQPRNEQLAVVLGCLLDPDCNTTSEQSTDSASAPCQNDCEENGEFETPEENTLRNKLVSYAATFGITDDTTIKDMIQQYNDISEKGYSNYAISTLLEKVGLADLSENVGDASNVIGWVNSASSIITAVAKAPQKLKVLSYATNSAASVSLFDMYRTYADEAKTGNVDPTEYGSFVDALGSGDHNNIDAASTDTEVGGTAGAEGSPLYSNIIDGNTPSPNLSSAPSLLSRVFSPSADAASSNTSSTQTGSQKFPYTCANGQGVPEGKLVCQEEVLGQNSGGILGSIESALSTPPLSYLVSAAEFFHSTVGQVFSFFGTFLSDIFTHVPGLSQITATVGNLIGDIIKPAENFLVSKLVPDPFGTDMSGARTFDMMSAGADVAGNDYSHNGIGGVALTPEQSGTIVAEQATEAKQEFQSQPIFARLFSTSSPYSLISRLADAIPIGKTAEMHSIASIFTNPLSGISRSFSTIISTKANAASTYLPDPFGITQYGYPAGTIPSDPETYWNQHCADSPASTNSASVMPDVAQGSFTIAYNTRASNPNSLDPNTGEPMNSPNANLPNDGTDPCLLIQAAIGSAGAMSQQSLLTTDDQADINPTTTNSATAANGNIYWVGDSLTVGMQSGGLQTDLTAKGFTVNKIEATKGDSVSKALPKVQADSTYLSNAGTVVVELGTNNCSIPTGGTPSCESTSEFEGEIVNMMSTIRSEDANAKVYWVNIYTTKGPEYQSINQALTADAASQDYTVIDWASEATTNSSKYSFDSSQGIHQATASGYSSMATFVTSQLGSATQTASSGTNYVAQALLKDQKPQGSIFSNVANVFSRLVSSVSGNDKPVVRTSK